jgi:hypothetical protein
LKLLSLSAPMPLTATDWPVFAFRTTFAATGEPFTPDNAFRVFAVTSNK